MPEGEGNLQRGCCPGHLRKDLELRVKKAPEMQGP